MEHRRPTYRRRPVAAFTLTELLITILVLGVLLAMCLPLFGRAVEMSRSIKCKANLRNLAAFLHVEDARARDLPGESINTIITANGWLDRVIDGNLLKLVVCPSGEPNLIGMKNLWIRQNGYNNTTSVGIYFTNIESVLAGGRPADPQVSVLYPAKGINYLGQDNGGWGWVQANNYGNMPAENQAFIAIATCAAFMVTLEEEMTTVTPLGHSPTWNSGSDHYIVRGDANEDTWENDTLVRLTGKNYSTVNPAVRVYTGECHYGMSNLVPTQNAAPGQLWMTEYSTDIMRLSTIHRDEAFDGDDENGEVMDRHFGSANYVKVDGSVTSLPKRELALEFYNLNHSINNIFED